MAVLSFAALPDAEASLKQLLKDFPEVVGSANHLGEMPIFRAAAYGCDAAVQHLLRARADPRMKRYDGVVPIQMAALRPDSGAFKLLAAARANFTARPVGVWQCLRIKVNV